MREGGSTKTHDGDESNDANEPNAAATTSAQRYTLKAIRSHRTAADGSTEYEVKWVGHSATTWEPAENIQEDAPKVVQAYEQFLTNRANARTTRSTARSQARPTLAADDAAADGDSSSDDEKESTPVEAARDVAAQRL